MLFYFRPVIYVPDGRYELSYGLDDFQPTDWIHIVVNYIGSNEGEGVRMYINGEKMDSDTEKTAGHLTYSTGDGRIVVGRRRTDKDQDYVSVQVDELIIFNRTLSNVEVESIYNAV